MKKILILLSIVLLSNVTVAQNDIETLEKMYRMVENDRARESQARDLVMSYYYDLKDKVREKSDRLTREEYNYLNKSMNMTWNQITNAIRDNYGSSYYEFYSQQRGFLEKFREGILDKLYEYIYD